MLSTGGSYGQAIMYEGLCDRSAIRSATISCSPWRQSLALPSSSLRRTFRYEAERYSLGHCMGFSSEADRMSCLGLLLCRPRPPSTRLSTAATTSSTWPRPSSTSTDMQYLILQMACLQASDGRFTAQLDGPGAGPAAAGGERGEERAVLGRQGEEPPGLALQAAHPHLLHR